MKRVPAYINGIGLISPQQTADPSLFLPVVMDYNTDYLSAIDPNYKAYIDPLAARRMSRLIKMGITAAKIALLDANEGHPSPGPSPKGEGRKSPLEDLGVVPDAIITGTGLGSVEDTERILNGMTAGEQLVNPTPFIQSTYNTISSQIAIILQCHNYNSTYVHRSFSFESALQDALLQFDEGSAATALVGGIDEMTANHLQITRRAGHWKMKPVNNLLIRSCHTPGALAGEGSAFFMLSSRPTPTTYAGLVDVGTFHRPGDGATMTELIVSFLAANGLSPGQMDAVVMGYNGDSRYDPVYDELSSVLFNGTQRLWYKHLCGEYYTSSGFALWLGANILKHQVIPAAVRVNDLEQKRLEHILIYNQYRNVNHSLILIRR